MKKGFCITVGLLYFLCCGAQQQRAYFSDFGNLSFAINDKKWIGVFQNQAGRIQGDLTDTVLTGKWTLNSRGGDIRIMFNKDFSGFRALYNHADTRDSTGNYWKSDWQGMKTPDTIIRKYQTPDGIIGFTMIGTQVEGVYPLYNGKILGEIIGTELKGIWLQSNRGFGNIKFKFADDFSSFEGTYNDFNFHPDKWGKWSGTLIR